MTDAPAILGINRTQDASICLMEGARLRWAIQKERLTRQRQHRGRVGDVRDVYGPRLPWPARPLDVVVECFSSDEERYKLARYDEELAAALRLAPDCRRARISHHLAHVYSAFHPSQFRAAAVMVIDGQGSPVAELTDHWSGAAYAAADWCEVASFYRADRERVHCIGKQLWDRDESRAVGLGMFYFLLAQAIFPGAADNEARVMDLAAHGDPHALDLPPLDVDIGQVTMPARWHAILAERERFHVGQPGVAFADCANLAAAGQRAFEDALIAVARWLHAETGLDDLCFAGGTALNGAANARLLRETPFQRIFIPPAPGNAGTAVGCALYGLTELAGLSCTYRWTRDDLGPVPSRADIDATLADRDDLRIEHLPDPAALCNRVLDLLAHGRVVALYQGGSEFGPATLGHRAWLADPRHAAMRDWIDTHVAPRPWFQPLSAAVLAERAADYADLGAPSPFMQFAAPLRPAMRARLGALGPAGARIRLQTVGPDDDPLLRRLLAGFETRTGVPVLLDIPFAADGEPPVETPQDALAALRRMPLHALAMPPFLVSRRIEPPVLA